MAGDADYKARWYDPAEDRRGNGSGTQMDAVRAAGHGHIGAVIDQNACAEGIGQLQNRADVRGQLARGQVLFADLKQIDAR